MATNGSSAEDQHDKNSGTCPLLPSGKTLQKIAKAYLSNPNAHEEFSCKKKVEAIASERLHRDDSGAYPGSHETY